MTDILVVDDEEDIRELISDILVDEGCKVRTAKNSDEVFALVQQRVPQVVILDIWLQGSNLDGLGILEQLKRKFSNLPIIMISGHGNIETAISAIKLGAYDYIEKPFKEERLLRLVKRAIETANLQQENERLRRAHVYESQLVGKSTAIVRLAESILKVAPTDSRVLISGPPGSGKATVARMIFERSRRSGKPFVVFDANHCKENAFYEQLFGSVADSAEGQVAGVNVGVFERANGGTLLIDEVASLPLSVQGDILRVLQNGCLERSGSKHKVEVDVRVIATTNKNLKSEISQGRFREDFYYRLCVVPLEVPALKDRREDIPMLVRYLLKRCAKTMGVATRQVDQSLLAAFERYHWPGNIRQLKNVVEWLLIMAPQTDGDVLSSTILPPDLLVGNTENESEQQSSKSDMLDKHVLNMPLRAAREVFERAYLSEQLSRFSGNISRTANFVGMERSAFHRKIKTLGIQNIEEVV